MRPLFDGRKTGARPSERLMRTGVLGKRDVAIHSAAAITFFSAAANCASFPRVSRAASLRRIEPKPQDSTIR
jgi:hypothetical protein